MQQTNWDALEYSFKPTYNREAKLKIFKAEEDARFAEEKLENSQHELSAAHTHIEELQEKLQTAYLNQRKLQNMLEEYVVSNTRQNPQELGRKYSELQKRLVVLEKERKEFVGQLAVLEKEKKDATEKWIRATAQLKQSERVRDFSKSFAVTKEKPRVEMVDKEVERIKAMLEVKDQTIKDQAEAIKGMHKDFAAKTQEVQKLFKEVQLLRDENEDFQKAVNEYERQLAMAKKANEGLSVRLNKSVEEKEWFKGKYNEMMDSYKKLEEKVEKNEEIKRQLEEYRNKLEMEQSKVQNMEIELQKMRNRVCVEQPKTDIPTCEEKFNEGEIIEAAKNILQGEDESEKFSKIQSLVASLFRERDMANEKYDRILRKYYTLCTNNSTCHTRAQSLSVQEESAVLHRNHEKENSAINESDRDTTLPMPVEFSTRSKNWATARRGSSGNDKRCVVVKLNTDKSQAISMPVTCRTSGESFVGTNRTGSVRYHSSKPSFANIRAYQPIQ
eukprot:TRINITY_DN138106_c0_g1_i1.p1 TRINITY_DN138106_c0_g1~~TRINITY_DN138106_c0_g1_i1.p1  ORF type:complete len:501 (-),score=79.76 TRINITY_DN138106_c0_g1_i1:71-1573(-)